MQSTSIKQNFDQIAESTNVKLNKKKSDEYFSKLFKTIVDKFQFKNNKYNFQGCYDLCQWLVLSFDTMVNENEEKFSKIVIPLVSYVSIVDDACDEKFTDSSIAEMNSHCKLFRGESVPSIDDNPALQLGQYVYELLKEGNSDKIIEKTLEFLQTGTRLIENTKNGCTNSGKISATTLEDFLKDRRIDSMASLFFTINDDHSTEILENDQDECDKYSELACDVISLFNDVASLGKDVGKVVNNYIILNKGIEDINNYLSFSELKKLKITEFESSLNEVLKLIIDKLDQMETIKSCNPSYSKYFESIQDVVNGYCTWCKTSKRFKKASHLISDFIQVETGKSAASLKPYKIDDMNTYFDDIEISKHISSSESNFQ